MYLQHLIVANTSYSISMLIQAENDKKQNNKNNELIESCHIPDIFLAAL